MSGRVVTIIECEGDNNFLLKFADSPDSPGHNQQKRLDIGTGDTYTIHALSVYLLTQHHFNLVREALFDIQRFDMHDSSYVYLAHGKVVNTKGGRKKRQ